MARTKLVAAVAATALALTAGASTATAFSPNIQTHKRWKTAMQTSRSNSS